MRINNWPTALINHMELNRTTPFKWGTHDCMLWAASCVEAITGFDPARELRGTYETALSAYRIIEGFGGFDETIEAILPGGAETRTHRNLAMRGDLVTTTDEKGRKALGVCEGSFGVFPGPDGLTFIKRSELDLRAWKVL